MPKKKTVKEYKPENVRIVFVCDECGKKESTDPVDAVYNGAPVCQKCHGEDSFSYATMDLSHVEIS